MTQAQNSEGEMVGAGSGSWHQPASSLVASPSTSGERRKRSNGIEATPPAS